MGCQRKPENKLLTGGFSMSKNKNLVPKIYSPFVLRRNLESPFDDMIDNMFNEFFNKFIPSKSDSFSTFQGSYPKCDIKDYPQKYQIQMEIPGMNKEDIKLEYNKQDQTLTISGKKRLENKQQNVNYLRRQLKKSEFIRTFYIASDQIEDEFYASFENGILIIDIAKKINEPLEEQTKKSKEIPIN